MATCQEKSPENPRSATLNAFPRVSHLSGNSWPARDENVAKTNYSNPAVIGLQLRCFIIQPITVEHIVLVLVLVLVFISVSSQTFRRFVIDPARSVVD